MLSLELNMLLNLYVVAKLLSDSFSSVAFEKSPYEMGSLYILVSCFDDALLVFNPYPKIIHHGTLLHYLFGYIYCSSINYIC
ncbi:hypothetical protein GMA8713_00011 [Grimontia marina]|uniref:Uncharacterized protein n=1 Tax=Grimontia marina TaxID=646534 RepID=A0A128ER07_9GAMM|nr:hypothetical protein GMA8713_00011 [Grimontia marina]